MPKTVQWDTPSEAFNAWWDSDYDDSTNPFTKDTFAYWAWAGWQAALAQPAQEPTLQEQLDKAKADWDKAHADWGKANADWGKAFAARKKADADWDKADADIKRINQLMEQQNG